MDPQSQLSDLVLSIFPLYRPSAAGLLPPGTWQGVVLLGPCNFGFWFWSWPILPPAFFFFFFLKVSWLSEVSPYTLLLSHLHTFFSLNFVLWKSSFFFLFTLRTLNFKVLVKKYSVSGVRNLLYSSRHLTETSCWWRAGWGHSLRV